MPARPDRREPPVTRRPAARHARRAARSGAAPPLAGLLATLMCTAAGGCAGLQQAWDRAVASDVANPAVPPPPPRLAGATVAPEPREERPAPLSLASSSGGRSAGGGEVKTADAFAAAAFAPAGPAAAAPRFGDADVVATVNGEPLLAGDLLQFDADLAGAAKVVADAPNKLEDPVRGLSPAQRDRIRTEMHRLRTQRLAERLPVKIEEALLAQRMRRSMGKEQLEGLDAMVAGVFEQTELPGMMERAGVQTKAELERVMASQGLTLKAVIDAWKPQQMAMGFVQQNVPLESVRVSRGEIRDYYDAHLAEFTPPRAARWSQIELSYGSAAEKSAALDVIEVAAADLRRGRTFAEVAEEYSQGPKSDDGGRWDWTKPGSLADDAADAALWAQPVGEVGAPVDCPRGAGGVLRLILVNERRGDAAPPLAELRDEIETRLKDRKIQRAVDALKVEERAAAQVEIFVPGVAWPPAG